MTLTYTVWFLLFADTIMTYIAVRKYGVIVESNRIMRAVMKIDYKIIVIISIFYGWAVYQNYISSVYVPALVWVSIYFFPGLAFVSNTIWFIKYWKRRGRK